MSLAVKAESPNHWTAEESPQICLFIFKTTYSEVYVFLVYSTMSFDK